MQLMQATEEWARKKGLADVRLHVFEFNAAGRAFYEQLGYRVLTRQLHKALSGDTYAPQ
jgi:GNAT superfamily N-acetyltransferase